MTWSIDATTLGTGPVTVLMQDEPRAPERERLQPEKLPEESEAHQHAGSDDARLSFTFRLVGPTPDIWTELDYIQDQITGDTVWTLANQDTDVRLWRDARRLALRTVNTDPQVKDGINHCDLAIQAVVVGEWRADTGTYTEAVSGDFEQQSDGSYTDEDGTDWDKPLVELPEQESGYPLAFQASDFSKAQPSLDSTFEKTDRDGNVQQWERYDLSGFLIPEPSATGDVGVYELESSPAQRWLGPLGTEALQTESGEDLTTEDGTVLLAQGQ